MKRNIAHITEEKGRMIAKAILSQHSEYPYLLGRVSNTKKGAFHSIKKGWFEAKEGKKMNLELCDIFFNIFSQIEILLENLKKEWNFYFLFL